MATVITLTQAKAKLSDIVREVVEKRTEYVLTVRGISSALIVPIPEKAPKSLKAAGILAGTGPMACRTEERAAYRKDVEERYAGDCPAYVRDTGRA